MKRTLSTRLGITLSLILLLGGGAFFMTDMPGYPALMVTDTAPFRYPHYHTGSDTPDEIDYPRLARVTAGLARVTVDLAKKER